MRAGLAAYANRFLQSSTQSPTLSSLAARFGLRQVHSTSSAQSAATFASPVHVDPATMPVYDLAVRWLHWIMAGGLVGCIGLVKAAQNSKGKRKGELMRLHKSMGLMMFGAMIPRVLLYLTRRHPGPVPGTTKDLHLVSTWFHRFMYGLVVFMPTSGVVMGYYGGRGLPFFKWDIPGAAKPNADVAKASWQAHKLAGLALMTTIPLHLGGAVYHWTKGHYIFRRINPFFSATKV